MPDLATHALSAYLLTAPVRERLPALAAVSGSLLPDLLAQGLFASAWALDGATPGRLPEWVHDGAYLFHTPFALVLLCGWVALLLPAAHRRGGFLALSTGGLLHIGLDLLQDHLGPAPYHPLFPFSSLAWEAGWWGTEDSLLVLPVLVPLALLVARRGRRRPAGQWTSNR